MTRSYELSLDAENDLRELARYTLDKWGRAALQKYRGGLKRSFDAIGKGTAQKRSFSALLSQVFVSKYQYHFIFYLLENREKPIIIGVIHEKRDVLNRLNHRLK